MWQELDLTIELEVQKGLLLKISLLVGISKLKLGFLLCDYIRSIVKLSLDQREIQGGTAD